MMHALAGKLRSVVTRGKVVLTSYSKSGGRVMLQVTGKAGATYNNVELLAPGGLSSRPGVGADVLILSIGGNMDHKIAIADDDIACRIPDLAQDEKGIRDKRAQQIVLRVDHLEIRTTLPVRIYAPSVAVSISGGALQRFVVEAFQALFNEHTHSDPQGGQTEPPSQQMTDAHLSGHGT
jgi:phage gp45-like